MGSDAASLALAVSGTLVDLQLERGVLLAQLAAERLTEARKANDQTVAATGKASPSSRMVPEQAWLCARSTWVHYIAHSSGIFSSMSRDGTG